MVKNPQPVLADARHAQLGEGPIWDAKSERLIWIDIIGGNIHFADDVGRWLETVHLDTHIGTAIPGSSGELLLATASGFFVLESDHSISTVNHALAEIPDLRFNDGKADPLGRAVVGTLSYSGRSHTASLMRLENEASLVPVLENVTLSNGLAWSEDGRTLYFVDTPTGRVDAFDYDLVCGTVSNRRIFVTVPAAWGLPDGICSDHDGGIWVALWGGAAVVRFTAEGELDARINFTVPNITSCAFGGPRGDTLFVTSASVDMGADHLSRHDEAGGLFLVDTGFTGPAATPWIRTASMRS